MDRINFTSILREVQNYLDEVLELEESMVFYQEPVECYKECCEINFDLLEELEPTFSQQLFKYIKAKGISETDCYKKSNIDRKLFSRIRTDNGYQPKKNTVFALIIGLGLNLNEAENLLESAGYAISHSIKLDTIMEYIIKKEIYDIITVNEILYSFGCPVLGAK